MPVKDGPGILPNIRWESFMAAVNLLTVVNALVVLYPGLPETAGVAAIVQLWLTPFLFFDFLVRLMRAQSKTDYLLKGFGWADLLGISFLSGMRLIRLFPFYRYLKYIGMKGARETKAKLSMHRSEGTLLSLIWFSVVAVEASAIYVLKAEAANPEATIRTPQEALWWAYVTITTVGYGDYAPLSTGGRLVAIALMTIGVAIIGIAAAYLSNWFLKERPKRQREKVGTDDVLLQMRRLVEEQEQAIEALHQKLDDLVKARAEHSE